MRRLAGLMAWGAGGHAVVVALFWWLVNVPESNTSMLALSAAIVALLLFAAALVEVTAVSWIVDGPPLRRAIDAGARGVTIFVLALVAFGACWWVAGRLELWHDAHAGELDAWLIATFGVTRTRWAHAAVTIVTFVMRWVVGTSLAVALLFAGTLGGLRAVGRPAWVRAALSRQPLALTAFALVAFVSLPWRAVYWKPAWLPPTAVEIAFVGVKLLAIYLLMHVGWVVVLLAGARAAAPQASQRS